ncbi:hypothetical protein F383_38143 [Gossypium arboreum]|uniref:Uncharacterized protein n=1 Tax=Gossypium arboreum TaxID=29729 RepID=A0A0B0MJN5_GOSAR|nr:hypothetical protein F383_38143 [Gossypium arboreum]
MSMNYHRVSVPIFLGWLSSELVELSPSS